MKKIIIIICFLCQTALIQAAILLDFPHYNSRLYGTAESLLVERSDQNNIDIFPASLAGLNGHTISFNYLRWQDTLTIQRIGCAADTKLGVIGGTIIFGSLDAIKNYDPSGNILGDVSSSEIMLNLGYGREIFKNILLGANLKYMSTDLGGYTGNWLGAGLSGIIPVTVKGININEKRNLNMGLGVQNLNIIKTGFDQRAYTYPVSVYTGFVYKFLKIFNTIEAKLGSTYTFLSKYNSQYISAGLELGYLDVLFLRGGYYLFGRDEDRINFGIGIGKDDLLQTRFLGKAGIRLDYGISLLEEGTSHFLQMTLLLAPVRTYSEEKIEQYKNRNIVIRETRDEISFKINKSELTGKDGSMLDTETTKILDQIAKLIKDEDYKNVIAMTPITNRKQNLEELKEQALLICKYLMEKDVQKDRISYKLYKKEKGLDGYKYQILLKRWKEEEKEKFEDHYFSGLDASIKEGHSEAIKEWGEALRIDPENIEVKTRLELEKAKQELKMQKLIRSDETADQKIRRIALFNFENTSRIKDFGYLSNTIPESIATHLARQKNLKVIDRRIIKNRIGALSVKNSDFKKSDLVKLLKEFWNIDTLITGSYIYSKGGLRINISLVNIDSGEILVTDQIQGSVDKNLFLLLDKTSMYILKKIEAINK
ncbi:MAG: hypothetical protein KKH98_08995 [Spirochaetes bacterium]|nr:hypothetical protein [Spirochaetota bacterium]